MSVKQHKARGYWYVDTIWPDGMRTRIRKPDQGTANHVDMKIKVACADEERIWKKLRKELRLEGGVLQGFSQFADLYLRAWVKVRNRSVRTKKSRIATMKAHFKSKPIDAITIQAIDGYVEARSGAGVCNRTINRDLAVLSHMFTWAAERGYFEENPIAKYPRLEEVEFVGARPDESAIDAIFAEIPEPARPAFVFMRETGCRRGEALGLTRSQVDFARAIVTFHTSTKNGKSRQVPLTEAALVAIAAMPRRGETVFYHPDTLKKWTGDSVSIPWERARKAAGHPELRMHDLRHAYAIKLAERGCPMHFISEVMGHHSVDFTRKQYAKFSPDSASRAVLRVLVGNKGKTGSEKG